MPVKKTVNACPRPVGKLPRVVLLAACLLVAAPQGIPADVSPSIPLPSQPAPPADTALLRLVAGLPPFRDADATPPDRHVVRREVRTYAVRLPVDPSARHPLDHPVAVRDTPLGAPGKPLRRVALVSPPAPIRTAQAPQTATPSSTSTTTPPPRVTASAAPRSVKILPTTPPAPTRPTGRALGSLALGPGKSVLVAGDSLSIFLAQGLRPLLAGRPGTSFAARGKVSSGLARPDFFDWEREMRALSLTQRPDTIFIMIAANDDKTMTRPDGKKVAFGRPGWNAEYARRVRRLVELARLGNPQARIYWVGAPVMSNPRLNADVAAINAVIRHQVAALPGCRFISVWSALADAAGHYTATLPARGGRRIRTRDGVHLTPYGARLLANACLTSLGPTVAALDKTPRTGTRKP